MKQRGENTHNECVTTFKVYCWCENNFLMRQKIVHTVCTSKNKNQQVQTHRKSHRKRRWDIVYTGRDVSSVLWFISPRFLIFFSCNVCLLFLSHCFSPGLKYTSLCWQVKHSEPWNAFVIVKSENYQSFVFYFYFLNVLITFLTAPELIILKRRFCLVSNCGAEVLLPLCSVRTVVLICTQHSQKTNKKKWNSCKETSHASNSRIKLLQPYRKLHRKKRCRQPILAQWAQAAAAFRGSFLFRPRYTDNTIAYDHRICMLPQVT